MTQRNSRCEKSPGHRILLRGSAPGWIGRTEPDKLWLKPLTAGDSVISPVPVPGKATELCQPTSDIGGVVLKTAHG
jgi:hypothetical protein